MRLSVIRKDPFYQFSVRNPHFKEIRKIVENVVEIIILFVFFLPLPQSTFICYLKSPFSLLRLRDPHFQEIRDFLCLLEPWTSSYLKLVFFLLNLENLRIIAAIVNKMYS